MLAPRSRKSNQDWPAIGLAKAVTSVQNTIHIRTMRSGLSKIDRASRMSTVPMTAINRSAVSTPMP